MNVAMSKLYENEFGIYISHKKFIDNLFKNIDDKQHNLNPQLFNIKTPFKTSKSNEKSKKNKPETYQEYLSVKHKFELFKAAFIKSDTFFSLHSPEENNLSAIETANLIYKNSEQVLNALGSNIGSAKKKRIGKVFYYFPENSVFFSKNVEDIETHLHDVKFDLILLDPPWWNKYIRRKRKKCGDAYSMMYNEDLKKLPIENLLSDEGFVVVWCTNSEQNYNDLLTNIFPKWQINFIAKWYWVKVTTNCEPICDFSEPPRKQPFERIVFGARKNFPYTIEDSKLLVSVPSAIHSHKPPLVEVLDEFLPERPTCLEIFARYLLPNWSSYGNEVLRFQHEAAFVTDENE